MTPNRLENFFDHLRNFFTGEEGSNTPATLHSNVQPGGPRHREPLHPTILHLKDSLEGASGPAASSQPNTSFEERLNQLEQRLETLTPVQPGGPSGSTLGVNPRHREPLHSTTLHLKDSLEGASGPAASSPSQHSAIENFVETLRNRGSFPPAFDRLGVAEFLQRLVVADAAFAEAGSGEEAHGGSSPAVSSGQAPEDNPQNPALLSWFQEFLSQLPRVIEFNELTPGQGAGRESATPPARVIRFTEPRRGVEVDPASIELAERAEAFAAEQGVTYAEALTQLRHSQRHTQSTA